MKEIESWQNGKWIPNSQIGTKLWDAHFFFGWAVFDAFRTYNHVPHLLHQHLDRLYRSAKLAEIEFSMTKQEMIEKIHEVIDHNKPFFPKDEEYRFMVFISPGYFKIYADMGDVGPIITINTTTTSRYAKFITPYLEKGFTALISSQVHLPVRCFDPKIKSCSRLHYGLADAEAARYGKGVQPILLDEHGYMTESSGSNVGLIKDGMLLLPKDHNILRGCTMEFVESLAKKNNISIIKDDWEVYDILDADAIIFTSTFLGIEPCYEVIFRNKKHRLTGDTTVIRTLFTAFSKEVGLDIEQQWKNWYAKML
ncbi:MAG: aminotransferase class IV [Candidatus Thermoplasmatota archaeon]